MASVVKEYGVRRNEILDEAQRLIESKGYEQMTIQEILDGLQISKVAFYHYFGSKQELLEAVIERMGEEVEQVLMPIVEDAQLPALEKFHIFFSTVSRWKTAQKEFLIALLRVWYTDDNVLVRQKTYTSGLKRIAPLLTAIIRQGVQEGVLKTSYPEHIGEVILPIIQSLSDTLARQLLSFEPERGDLQHAENTVAAYTNALERVLGAPQGSLELVDSETLKEWFYSPRDNT